MLLLFQLNFQRFLRGPKLLEFSHFVNKILVQFYPAVELDQNTYKVNVKSRVFDHILVGYHAHTFYNVFMWYFSLLYVHKLNAIQLCIPNPEFHQIRRKITNIFGR